MKILTQENGFITLLSIVVVSGVGLAVILAISLAGVNSIKTSGDLVKSNQAKALANACAETALQEIRDSAGFLGSGNLSLGDNDCSYVVSNTGGENRRVESIGTAGDIVRKVKVLVDAINPQINITSWQEVGDF